MRGHTFPPFRSSIAAESGTDAGAAESSCFADEVVVDFPSVAPAVDRIRLSQRDRLDGTTVPLTGPGRCTSRGCGGSGESWTESCVRCAGSGTEVLDHQVQVTVPAGVEHGTRVQFVVTPPQHPPTRIELRIAIG